MPFGHVQQTNTLYDHLAGLSFINCFMLMQALDATIFSLTQIVLLRLEVSLTGRHHVRIKRFDFKQSIVRSLVYRDKSIEKYNNICQRCPFQPQSSLYLLVIREVLGVGVTKALVSRKPERQVII